MRYGYFVLVAIGAFAQQPAPIGVSRGDVVGVSPSGIIDFKNDKGVVYRCGSDASTRAERGHDQIALTALKAAESIEVTASRQFGGCYVKLVRVIPARLAAEPFKLLRPVRSAFLDQMFPRGNLTYAGVVLRHNSQTLVLRTRTQGEKILLLRDDTRFLDSGLIGSLSQLTPNTRVFVRAGRNFENELEVYQVVWGTIDGPGTSAQ